MKKPINTSGEFCFLMTSVQKNMKNVKRFSFLRFIWILITLIMFICAVVMVFTFYVDYHSNPTRMNVENDHAPISSLLFPPVTICPEVAHNTQKSKLFLEQLYGERISATTYL